MDNTAVQHAAATTSAANSSAASSATPSRQQVGLCTFVSEEEINKLLQRKYNCWWSFTENMPLDSNAHREWMAFENSVRKLEEAYEDAQRQILEQIKSLKIKGDAAISAIINASGEWYLDGDLTGVEYHDLRAMLMQKPIKKAKTFYEYLKRILPLGENARPTLDEEDDLSMSKCSAFMEKALALVKHLSGLRRGKTYAVHAYVFLLSDVFVRNKTRISHAIPYRRVARALQKLIRRRRLDGGWKCFVNYAAAHRQICQLMRWPCYREYDWYGPLKNYACVHIEALPIVASLQRHAWAERRANVFATIGTKLSAELTQEIFEWVLVAEEIPLSPEPPRLLNWEDFDDAHDTKDGVAYYACRWVPELADAIETSNDGSDDET